MRKRKSAPTRLSSWISDQSERRCWNEEHVRREAGPPGPRLSSSGEQERNAVMAVEWGSSERYIFLKNCVARLYCVVLMILHECMCVCIVGHSYTTYINLVPDACFSRHMREFELG